MVNETAQTAQNSPFIFLIVATVVLYSWFFSRKKFFPISGRNPHMMIIVGIFLTAKEFIIMFNYDFVPCEVTSWLSILTLNTCIILYTQRAWILLFHFEITENIGVLNQMKRSGASVEELKKEEGWYLRNRQRIRPSHLALWFALDFLVQLLLLTIATIYDSPRRSCNAEDSTVLTQKCAQILNGVRGLLIAGLAWKLRSKGLDNFMVKSELKWVCIIIIVPTVACAVLAVIYPPVNWTLWGGFVATTATFWPSVLRPLKESYIEESRQKERDSMNLRTIIKGDVGFRSFLSFLTTEFSTENLLCWRELDEWFGACGLSEPPQNFAILTRVELYRRSHEIFSNYLDELEAPYLVNVSDAIRKQARMALETVGAKLTSFGTPSPTVPASEMLLQETFALPTTQQVPEFETLVEAYQAVEIALYDLMNNDSFPRYKVSEFFMNLELENQSKEKITQSKGTPGSTTSKLSLMEASEAGLSSFNEQDILIASAEGDVELGT